MWRSKDDFVKDLAYLNDFGAPGDLEPFKVFYSNGRGSRIKRMQESAKFTDTRTGEVIQVDDLPLTVEDRCQSKGRGKLLSGFSSAKFQLEKQLRLAKPMGSSDEAIVSYFRKNRQTENSAQSNTQSNNMGSEIIYSTKCQNKLTVKGIRNSVSQKNALMDALLSKSEESRKVKESEDSSKLNESEESRKLNESEESRKVNESEESTPSQSSVECDK